MRTIGGLLPWLASIAPNTSGAGALQSLARPQPPTYGFRLLGAFPHDAGAFTQGLEYDARTGTLLESTGLYGASTARRVAIESGRVLEQHDLEPSYFGEGIATSPNGACLQLLWREGLCLVRDAETLRLRRTLPLPRGMREGWGLTHDGGSRYYASDGTERLHVLDDETLEVERTVTVRAGGRVLGNVNDLQWVRGELWANLWREDRICAINPETGDVRCFVDLSDLLTPTERRTLGYEEVLNGLAWDEARECFYATGKCWPRLFQIQVLDERGS